MLPKYSIRFGKYEQENKLEQKQEAFEILKNERIKTKMNRDLVPGIEFQDEEPQTFIMVDANDCCWVRRQEVESFPLKTNGSIIGISYYEYVFEYLQMNLK